MSFPVRRVPVKVDTYVDNFNYLVKTLNEYYTSFVLSGCSDIGCHDKISGILITLRSLEIPFICFDYSEQVFYYDPYADVFNIDVYNLLHFADEYDF